MNKFYLVASSIRLWALFALLSAFSPVSLADWSLMHAESDIAFVTVKNNAVVESHTFTQFTGSVSAEGEAQVNIDLASVETQIPIRNERMAAMLFETVRFPSLKITSKFDPATLGKMEEGASLHIDVPAKITMHGTHADMRLPIVITKLSAKRFQVVTAKPIVAYASQFDLTQGVEALRVIAKLATITPAVPVTFSLIFEQDS